MSIDITRVIRIKSITGTGRMKRNPRKDTIVIKAAVQDPKIHMMLIIMTESTLRNTTIKLSLKLLNPMMTKSLANLSDE